MQYTRHNVFSDILHRNKICHVNSHLIDKRVVCCYKRTIFLYLYILIFSRPLVCHAIIPPDPWSENLRSSILSMCETAFKTTVGRSAGNKARSEEPSQEPLCRSFVAKRSPRTPGGRDEAELELAYRFKRFNHLLPKFESRASFVYTCVFGPAFRRRREAAIRDTPCNQRRRFCSSWELTFVEGLNYLTLALFYSTCLIARQVLFNIGILRIGVFDMHMYNPRSLYFIKTN